MLTNTIGDFMVGTIFAFAPAVVAIVMALATKQVYLSLFVGIFVGAMFVCGFNPIMSIQKVFEVLTTQLGENGGLLIFLVILGMFSVLLVKSGGSNAYSNWAYSKIKSKKGALLMGVGLGAVLSVDDYFDCVTLGSIMRPITDKHKISHSKLSYLIHSTAAPFCIIAPISSWSASIGTQLEGGIVSFFKTIPLNLYALLAIAMVLTTSFFGFDFFKMKKDERIASSAGDLFSGEKSIPDDLINGKQNSKGRVFHLVLPIVVLIVSCISCMIYNGYLNIVDASNESFGFFDLFEYCDTQMALSIGSFIALCFTVILYISTKVLTFRDAMDSIVEGFNSMAPGILILVFAWTICAIMGARGAGLDESKNVVLDGTLNLKAFVLKNVSAESVFIGILPFVFFLIAAVISFSTGTSWGTFGVLIPIASAVVSLNSGTLYFLTMSAILAGAVYGDNASPISDTTVLASSSAQCSHLNHFKSQLPYASIPAIIASIVYLVSGLLLQNKAFDNYLLIVAISLILGFSLFIVTIFVLRKIDKRKEKNN